MWPELEQRYGADAANELHDGWKQRMARFQRWRIRLGTPFGIDERMPPKPRYGPRIRELERQAREQEQRERKAAWDALRKELAGQALDPVRVVVRSFLERSTLHPDGKLTPYIGKEVCIFFNRNDTSWVRVYARTANAEQYLCTAYPNRTPQEIGEQNKIIRKELGRNVQQAGGEFVRLGQHHLRRKPLLRRLLTHMTHPSRRQPRQAGLPATDLN